MIREFSVKPKPSNNKARAAFIISMALSFALICISTFIPLYKGLVSLGGVGLLSVAIVLYTRFIAPVYFYDIFIDSNGVPLFIVRQQVGKKYTTLCRISLHEIVKIEKQTRDQLRQHKTGNEMKKYSYLPTLDPDQVYRITTSGRYEGAEILIESSDEFANMLLSYSTEARGFSTYEE